MPAENKRPGELKTPNIAPSTSVGQKNIQNLVKPSPKELLSRIPVSGLYNFLYASGKCERCFWTLILVVGASVTLSYFLPTLINFLRFEKALNVNYVYDPSTPFPDIYVNIPYALNVSYFREKFAQVMPAFRNDSRAEYWGRIFNITADQISSLNILYMTSEVENIDNPWGENLELIKIMNELIYRGVLAFGSAWPGIKNFYEEAPFNCKQIFVNCEFNDEAFPCCSDQRSFSFSMSVHVFYYLNVSKNVKTHGIKHYTGDLPYLSFSTKINESLSVAASQLDLEVHVGNDKIGLFQPSLQAQADAKSFFLVKSKRRKLLNKCYGRFRFDIANHRHSHPLLQEYFKSMESSSRYSVSTCETAKLLEEFYLHCGCVPYFDSIKPNDSVICTPAHLYICYHLAFKGMGGDGSNTNTVNVLQSLKDRTTECLPLCDTWGYEVQVTYSPLAQVSPEGMISNQVTIAMEPEYRLEADVLKFDFMTFFAVIGDWMTLFLGLSIVTLVQAPVWTVAAFHFSRKQPSPAGK